MATPANSTNWILRKVDFVRGADWNDSLKLIGAFSDAHQFRRDFYMMKPSVKLGLSGDFNFFRQGINPTWEEPANVNGGRFVTQLKTGDYNDFDDFWLRVAEFIMTAQFEGAKNINGALVKIRQKPNTVRTIAIWIRDDQQQAKVKRHMEMKFGKIFFYTSHKDQEQRVNRFK